MHTSEYDTVEYGKFYVHHNGDWSGEIKVNINPAKVEFVDNSGLREHLKENSPYPESVEWHEDYYEINIPYEVIESVVGDKIRSDMIERLEQMTAQEVLNEYQRT